MDKALFQKYRQNTSLRSALFLQNSLFLKKSVNDFKIKKILVLKVK